MSAVRFVLTGLVTMLAAIVLGTVAGAASMALQDRLLEPPAPAPLTWEHCEAWHLPCR